MIYVPDNFGVYLTDVLILSFVNVTYLEDPGFFILIVVISPDCDDEIGIMLSPFISIFTDSPNVIFV